MSDDRGYSYPFGLFPTDDPEVGPTNRGGFYTDQYLRIIEGRLLGLRENHLTNAGQYRGLHGSPPIQHNCSYTERACSTLALAWIKAASARITAAGFLSCQTNLPYVTPASPI